MLSLVIDTAECFRFIPVVFVVLDADSILVIVQCTISFKLFSSYVEIRALSVDRLMDVNTPSRLAFVKLPLSTVPLWKLFSRGHAICRPH